MTVTDTDKPKHSNMDTSGIGVKAFIGAGIILASSLLFNCAFVMWMVYLIGKGVVLK